MRKTEKRRTARAGKGIKSRGFHLDRQYAFGSRSFYRRGRFAEWRVGGPCRTDKKRLLTLLKRGGRACDQARVRVCVVARRGVVVAGAFVAQGAIDDDKVRRGAARGDLARRCEAEQEPAAAGEQFFGNQNSKWRADNRADNPYRLSGQFKAVQLCVIARPGLKRLRSVFPSEPPHDVAIGIENADGWHVDIREPFLPPRFAQQCGRTKHGWRRWVLVVEQWRHGERSKTPQRNHILGKY